MHLLDALFLNDEGHAAAGIYYPEIRNCSGKGQAAAQRISELEQEIPEIVKKGTNLWIGWEDSGIMGLIAWDLVGVESCITTLCINIINCTQPCRLWPSNTSKATTFGAAKPGVLRQEPAEAKQIRWWVGISYKDCADMCWYWRYREGSTPMCGVTYYLQNIWCTVYRHTVIHTFFSPQVDLSFSHVYSTSTRPLADWLACWIVTRTEAWLGRSQENGVHHNHLVKWENQP